jgi:carboxypeptidase T
VNHGMSIESVVEDMSYGFAPLSLIQEMEKSGIKIETHFPISEFSALDFPGEDSQYHNYNELMSEIQKLVEDHPEIVHVKSIGKTTEGKDMWAIRINSAVKSFDEATALPGIIFMGGHHAREHLSIELPLMYAQHLANNYGKDQTITDLINRRDIYIIPMVNVDGAEFDISTGSYKMWRKNRKINSGNSCAGVDLNRNYGYGWGTGGSSTSPCSDVYMGPSAFSEKETQNIKAFVESRPNAKILLSFHSFSELILYPWGGKNDPIDNMQDRNTYIAMARTMAGWNGYTPEQSSELYIASGDTTDWSYGTLGIFSFTFELEPRDQWGGGGFYPGSSAIQHAFDANLRPIMYLIDLADNPHRASTNPETTLFFGR